MENGENRINDFRFIGKIDYNQSSFAVGQNNDVRLKVEIISQIPKEMPFNKNEINVFSNDISTLKLFDAYEDKQLQIEEYLKDRYLIFSVRSSKHKDPAINTIYYNAYNIELKKKNEWAKENDTFQSIPLIPSSSEITNSIMQKLVNNQYLTYNPHDMISNSTKPKYVCIGDINRINDEGFEKFSFIGEIADVVSNEKHGIKYLYNEKLKELVIEEEDMGEYYISNDNILFIEDNAAEYIHKKLVSEGIDIETEMEYEEVLSPEETDETEFIDYFANICLNKGLYYAKKDLINFHTAMKTNSFVILSGMSGTGKSKLVQCYYEAINNGEKTQNRLLFIPVKPSWQDDSDLLGYLDTVNNIYRPGDTGLVDFIREANEKENRDECYIVCLDEMNLSKVEHYFSQFLSILEREPKQRKLNLYNSERKGKVYNQNDYPENLSIGENVFFVGTINTDESTHSFSDKVLDRSNIIELELQNFADIKKNIENFSKESLVLSENRQPSFIKFNGMKVNDQNNKLNNTELEFLWKLHITLNKNVPNIGVGMRIVNQIESYVMNLPKNSLLSRKEAIDLQILQRVLTKIAGSESLLAPLIRRNENSELEGELLDLFKEFNDLSDFKRSIEKLYIISMELNEYGHTL